ncbi:MAG: hypothetical protein ABI239_08995 [Aquihabitans sp.]
MDLLTTTDLKALAEPIGQGPAVSLFMPTHRVVTDAEVDPLGWKNLLTGAASSLEEAGVAKSDADELLAPAWELHADSLAWQHMSDGLVMLLRPGWHRMLRVPVEVPQVAIVGDRFVMSPLLGAISGEEHFLVLTVSQRKIRLLEGTRHRIEEVELSEVPTSLRDVIEAPDPRSDTMARPAVEAGRPGSAIFYGYGAADDDFKKAEVMEFFRRVADGLHTYLADQDHPMVLVGLDEQVGAYREVNNYGNVLAQSVDHNPDRLSAEELYEAVWPIVSERFAQAKHAATERFNELHGTGQASVDPTDIETAASQGRVEALFLTVGPSCWNEVSGHGSRAIRLGAEVDSAACEQLDRTVISTLVKGGSVYSVAEPSLIDGASVAATFRY